jgi:hypothetical protein
MIAYIYRNNELQKTEHIHGDKRPYGKGKERLRHLFKELQNLQWKDGNTYYIELKHTDYER